MKFIGTYFVLISFLLPLSQYAYGQKMSEQVQTQTKTTKKEEGKKRRRKKVMMCHECGKPEIECECEGEGHGVGVGHNHE
ncbi:MAG: hypothetical protein QF441_12995 [Bacteriovoracaceae bacterium]|jgi:hypothetical protein|nr:hypothetical protein [Halobacteriovoraceae bacterium]MDP7321521.1 hypothetical protein [Bacteriovoracaceae bacterium]